MFFSSSLRFILDLFLIRSVSFFSICKFYLWFVNDVNPFSSHEQFNLYSINVVASSKSTNRCNRFNLFFSSIERSHVTCSSTSSIEIDCTAKSRMKLKTMTWTVFIESKRQKKLRFFCCWNMLNKKVLCCRQRQIDLSAIVSKRKFAQYVCVCVCVCLFAWWLLTLNTRSQSTIPDWKIMICKSLQQSLIKSWFMN